ncbi:hypothetical protein ABZ671_01160 [Micromonospora sp. NPDC006766]|uniref:hypothetical protein n=1 Tax=Micromonospora sp. NPDC006766 TaxID=3154778 RepID=UPI0033C41988
MTTTTKTPTPWAAIATTTRAAIKTARTNGTLTLPDNAKVSVRAHSFAGGWSVDIAVTNVDPAWVLGPDEEPYGPQKTKQAKALAAQLADLLNDANNGSGWGDVTINGTQFGGVHPRSYRPGQD